VIGSVLPRGKDVGGLLRYLFREGRAGEHGLAAEHTAPRLIAAWDSDLPRLEPELTVTGRRDVRALASALSAPVAAASVDPATKPVYHLAIAAAKDPRTGQLLDKDLSDGQWADIAAEYVHQIGLARRGDEQAVRWVAVRHADDHIHVVATLARQDGRRVFPRNDHYRAREASLTVEARYDLIRTSPAGRTSSPPPSRGETRKHQATVDAQRAAGRTAPAAPDRLVLRQLVRAAAAGSSGWEDFTEQLQRQGVQLRPRMSEKTPGQITGYAVALPGGSNSGQAIWFGGGKLAPDLTLPQLQRRWSSHEQHASPAEAGDARVGQPRPGAQDAGGEPRPRADRFGLTPHERQGLWQAAQDATSGAAAQISATVAGGADPRLAGDAAWAGADLLAVVAQLTERRAGGPYTDAARAFEHAGRDQRHRQHVRTPASRRLRNATTALSAVGVALPSERRQLLQLTQQLTRLADAVARLRQTQAHAAQAAAARAAAEQLRALHPAPVRLAPFSVVDRLRSVTVHGTASTPPRRRR
jgi:hypothetical protein